MEDRYVCVQVTTDSSFTERVCAALEDAGIAVMVEHLQVNEYAHSGRAFRILTPGSAAQKALKLLASARNSGHAVQAAA